jgi:hypothetical protein
MAGSGRNGGLIVGLIIPAAVGLVLGGIAFSMAGSLYQKLIVDRVVHMNQKDLGIHGNAEMEDMISRVPSDMEKFKTVTYPEMKKQYDTIIGKYGQK